MLRTAPRTPDRTPHADSTPHRALLATTLTGLVTTRELQGRTALVTGVSRRAGIGAAIARELATAGARLFVSYYRPYDHRQAWGAEPDEPARLLGELREIAPHVFGLELDLSAPDAAGRLFRAARDSVGDIDILVNNAAHWEAGGLETVTAEALDRHYAVNARAPLLLCAEFARQLPRGAAGRIINITSGQSQTPMPGQIGYVVTKAALDALTLTLGAELADREIAIIAVDPGPTDTGWISKDTRDALERDWPLGISSPEEIGRLVRRLTGEAGRACNGQVVRAQRARV
jgi:3-oxoacyl-[acyl-carrier protein] reductase